jgi:hypothetical protein
MKKTICEYCWKRITTLKSYRAYYVGDKVAYDTFVRSVKKWMFPQEAIKPKRKHSKHYKVQPQKMKLEYSQNEEEFL